MEKLGKFAKDKITGFEGIICGKTVYLFGCTCYGITPKSEGGKLNDTMWFDEGRLEIVSEGFNAKDVQVAKPGGMHRAAPNNIAR